MLFVSQLMNLHVRARDASAIGLLTDVVVRIDDRSYPPISGIVVRDQRRAMFIPAADIVEITYETITLNTMQLNLQRFSRRDGEVLLNKDVLDHQIIDINGRRIVRVNDIQMARIEHEYCVVGVDISPQALLRRLAPRAAALYIVGRQVISWADAQYLASAAPVQLKVSYNRLNEMSAVDLARIVDALSYRESAEIVAALDDETAAETLEEVSDERMADLLEGMDQERAADILEEMTPSAAADLLEDLDADVAEQILARMEPEEAEDVKELLAYAGDSVGRSMTTDLVVAFPDDNVEDVIRSLRARDELPDPLTEIYVVEHHDVDEGMDGIGARLIGIVRIPKLLVTRSDVLLRDILEEVPTIHVDDPSENAARVLGEYNLTAVPVVDSDGMLVGAVSVDDALAVLLPDIWHRRGSRNFG
jgi:CBS domain-containing protein